MEVLSINAMAPFIINARLKPLLQRQPEVGGVARADPIPWTVHSLRTACARSATSTLSM
jgi:hypothetical protein